MLYKLSIIIFIVHQFDIINLYISFYNFSQTWYCFDSPRFLWCLIIWNGGSMYCTGMSVFFCCKECWMDFRKYGTVMWLTKTRLWFGAICASSMLWAHFACLNLKNVRLICFACVIVWMHRTRIGWSWLAGCRWISSSPARTVQPNRLLDIQIQAVPLPIAD